MSSNRLPKPPTRITPGVYQLSYNLRVARREALNGEYHVDLPAGHPVQVGWASKRWAECETFFRPPLEEKSVILTFRIPTNVLEDMT